MPVRSLAVLLRSWYWAHMCGARDVGRPFETPTRQRRRAPQQLCVRFLY